MLSKQQSLANASFECAKLCLANFLRTCKFALQRAMKVSREIQAVAITVFSSSLETSLSKRVSRDDTLVSREGGNLLLSGTAISNIQDPFAHFLASQFLTRLCRGLVLMAGIISVDLTMSNKLLDIR